MSRSNNTEVRNPAVKFFKWSGDDGQIKYYDKENKENIVVDLPFIFLVLDRLTTIAGFCDTDQSGFWSNEIRNVKTDVLTVRTAKGIVKTGLYEDIKGVTGVKYAQSVYIAFFDENKVLQIGNFKFTGCAVSAWIEFCKGKDIYKGAIKIIDRVAKTKGKSEYFEPVFAVQNNIKEETDESAKALDIELQEYLTAYFALRGQENAKQVNGNDYIAERNRELEDYQIDHNDEPMPLKQVGDDDDIPF